MDDARPLCMTCADMDTSCSCPPAMRPSPRARRARRASGPSAVVVRLSQARRRYECQGALVEEPALDDAAAPCLADAELRARRRQRGQPEAPRGRPGATGNAAIGDGQAHLCPTALSRGAGARDALRRAVADDARCVTITPATKPSSAPVIAIGMATSKAANQAVAGCTCRPRASPATAPIPNPPSRPTVAQRPRVDVDRSRAGTPPTAGDSGMAHPPRQRCRQPRRGSSTAVATARRALGHRLGFALDGAPDRACRDPRAQPRRRRTFTVSPSDGLENDDRDHTAAGALGILLDANRSSRRSPSTVVRPHRAEPRARRRTTAVSRPVSSGDSACGPSGCGGSPCAAA